MQQVQGLCRSPREASTAALSGTQTLELVRKVAIGLSTKLEKLMRAHSCKPKCRPCGIGGSMFQSGAGMLTEETDTARERTLYARCTRCSTSKPKEGKFRIAHPESEHGYHV